MKERLIQALGQYILDTLGTEVKIIPWVDKGTLPLYLTERYAFHRLTLFDRPYIVAVDREEKPQSPAALRKQLDRVREILGNDVIYVREMIAVWNRRRLIEQKLSFIVPGNQLYLPLLGMDLREYIRLPLKKGADVLSPATTRILLHLLYQRDKNTWTAKEIAVELMLSGMTVSRAFDELQEAGLFKVEKVGKTRRISRDQPGKDIWKRAAPVLRSPVTKKVFIERKDLPQNAICSGCSALAAYTSLAAPDIPEYAVSSENWRNLTQSGMLQAVSAPDRDTAVLEIWKNDPKEFAEGGIADALTVILTLKGTDDDRIASALDAALDTVKW